MAESRLIDQYDRHLNYLRVSITDRCNLNCRYCEPYQLTPKMYHRDILRYEEILRIVRIGVTLGVTKLRVTGGEPLVRKGVYHLLNELGGIEELTDISLTTNGVLLYKNLQKIKDAGIRRLNISLDTLKRDKYENLTGRDTFDTVWRAILEAHDMGFSPIKINAVVLNGINDDELTDLAALSLKYPWHIRFIEHMPIGSIQLESSKKLLTPDIKERLKPIGELDPIGDDRNTSFMTGPAERYRFKGAKGEIGFISPISRHFCQNCNRLRLTADGKLRPCLLSDHAEDIKGPLRKGMLDGELVKVFLRAVQAKPSGHRLKSLEPEKIMDQMSSIGG